MRFFHRVAKRDIDALINYLTSYLQSVEQNEVGVDKISEKGLISLIGNLKVYESEILAGGVDPNPIWAILAAHAPYLTTGEYTTILDYVDNMMRSDAE